MNKQMPDDETYTLIGVAMKVHGELGGGFLEMVYKDAFELELCRAAIPYEREKKMHVYYCGEQLKSYYVADFVCYESVVVEAKAIPKLTKHEESQLLNYLKITRCKRGLILNFSNQSLEYKRMVF